MNSYTLYGQRQYTRLNHGRHTLFDWEIVLFWLEDDLPVKQLVHGHDFYPQEAVQPEARPRLIEPGGGCAGGKGRA